MHGIMCYCRSRTVVIIGCIATCITSLSTRGSRSARQGLIGPHAASPTGRMLNGEW